MRRLALIACLLGSGCADVECGDDDLAWGIELLIREPGGPYDEPVSVRYRVDDGAWFEISDTEAVDPLDDAECPERGHCFIGLDRTGDYEVEVRRGAASASFPARVIMDYCSARTVRVPVELPET